MSTSLKAFIEMALILAALVIGYRLGQEQVRREAVDAGAAKHIFTDEYGNTEYKWLSTE